MVDTLAGKLVKCHDCGQPNLVTVDTAMPLEQADHSSAGERELPPIQDEMKAAARVEVPSPSYQVPTLHKPIPTPHKPEPAPAHFQPLPTPHKPVPAPHKPEPAPAHYLSPTPQKPVPAPENPVPAPARKLWALVVVGLLFIAAGAGAAWYFDLHRLILPAAPSAQVETPVAPVPPSTPTATPSPTPEQLAERLILERLGISTQIAAIYESTPNKSSLEKQRPALTELQKNMFIAMAEFDKLPAEVRKTAEKNYSGQIKKAEVRIREAFSSIPPDSPFKKIEKKRIDDKQKQMPQ